MPTFLASLLLAFWLFWRGTLIIPAYHYAVPYYLGWIGKTKLNGFVFQFPFFVKWKFVSTKEDRVSGEIKVLASDNIEVSIPFEALFKPDPNINVRYGPNEGTNRFVTIQPEAFLTNLKAGLAAYIEGAGGHLTSAEFKKRRAEMVTLLNAMVRMQAAPHYQHDPATCGLTGCSMATGEVRAEELLDYYKAHHHQIIALLESERGSDERSEIERGLGVEMTGITVPDVKFDDPTIAANEAAAQARLRLASAQPIQELISQIRTEDPNITYAEAWDRAANLLAGLPMNVTVFHGLETGGAIGAAVAKMASSDSGKGDNK